MSHGSTWMTSNFGVIPEETPTTDDIHDTDDEMESDIPSDHIPFTF